MTKATHKGGGWQERPDSVTAWVRCGYSSEVDKLSAVMLATPTRSVFGDPNDHLMEEAYDLAALKKVFERLEAVYILHDVTVYHAAESQVASPNFIFQRDLYFMTEAGAILARPASLQRAGEEWFAAKSLVDCSFPIFRIVTQPATFEGADILRVRPGLALVGVGNRTNELGYGQIEQAFRALDVKTLPVVLPKDVQHLLGCVNLVDHDLAVVYQGAEQAVVPLLAYAGIKPLVIPDSAEFRRRAMNFVTLGPRKILMPEGCPITQELLEARDVKCVTIDIQELTKAAGGMGCATGVLRRDSAPDYCI